MSTYSLPLVCINGLIHSYSDSGYSADGQPHDGVSPLVSPQDRGLAYGDGLFETILLVDGLAPLLSYHHKRLLKGLERLNITLNSERLVADVNKLLDIAKTLELNKQLVLMMALLNQCLQVLVMGGQMTLHILQVRLLIYLRISMCMIILQVVQVLGLY